MKEKRKRHAPEQIVKKLRDSEVMLASGRDLAEVLQTIAVSEATFNRWRNQYGGMKSEEAKRLKSLEGENSRLKKLLAEAELDKAMLKEALNRLAELFVIYGVPKFIRSDNGPEFVAISIQTWLSMMKVNVLYVEPGSPWQNGYAESFHSRLRDELLNMEQFESVRHARECIAAWRDDYNDDRPHGALNGLTPSEYARRCADSVPVAALLPRNQHSEPLQVTQPVLS